MDEIATPGMEQYRRYENPRRRERMDETGKHHLEMQRKDPTSRLRGTATNTHAGRVMLQCYTRFTDFIRARTGDKDSLKTTVTSVTV